MKPRRRGPPGKPGPATRRRDHVVTEFGAAKLRGKTARQRALALIEVAHPDFRSDLREAARKMNRI